MAKITPIKRLQSGLQTGVSAGFYGLVAMLMAPAWAVDNPPVTDSWPTAAPVVANTPRPSRFSVGEELILSVSANKLPLASIFAVKSPRAFQVGLGDFFQVIEFPIYVDPARLTAEGWFYSERNRFALSPLDDGSLQVQVNDRRYRLAPEDYRAEADDLYVDIEAFITWFDLGYELNEEQLALTLISATPFPVEQRLARLNSRRVYQGAPGRAMLPPTGSHYQWLSPPLLDIQVSALHNDYTTAGNYSVLARQDVARFNAELFLSGNDQKSLNAAWLNLSRQSLNGDLLGPLGATEYMFGDITPVNTGFGRTQAQSLGFALTNTPLTQLADNRRVNLSGEVQVGWDVELYRNGILLDAAFNLEQGRYEFNDVDLDFGDNDFEIVLYGPQGQIETRRESYVVDSNTTLAGQGHYRFSLVDIGQSVFGVNDFVEQDPSARGLQASFAFDYGLSDWLSLTTGIALFEPEQGDQELSYSLRGNTSFGRYGLASLGVSGSNDDQRNLSASYRTRVYGTSYGLSFLRSERDLADPDADPLRSDSTQFTMTGQLWRASRFPFSYQNTWQRFDNNQGVRRDSLQNALGVNGRWGSLNNSLTWINDRSSVLEPDVPEDPIVALNNQYSLAGGVQYRKNFGRLHTRVFHNYALRPEQEVISYGGALNVRWTPRFTTDLRYAYWRALDLEQWNLGLNWRQDAFHISATAAQDSNDQWSVGLTLRFSMGYEPLQRRVFSSGRPLAQSGAVAVRVFEDLNMNGVFDEGEPLLENVTVRAVQGYRRAQTNAAGVAVITPLFDATVTDIVVDEATLDGPFMITAIPGVSVAARRGFLEQVELPVVKAGELEGYVYLHDQQGVEQPAAYVMLNLINAQDQVVASARTEYDGFYLFTEVVPGDYRLKVDPAYIDRRGLRKVDERALAFSSDGDVISGVDFMLFPLQSADGYVAVAGRFDSPAMLKLYYQVVRQRLQGQFPQQPFYIRSAETGQYVLGLAYYEGEQEAEERALSACLALQPHAVRCEVEYHRFNY